MPELAEVSYYARRWAAHRGERVLRVHARPEARVFRGLQPGQSPESLFGQRLRESRTHGKRMLFGFSGGWWLEVHLGMSGELAVRGADHQPERHEHLVLCTCRAALVLRDPRMFGRVALHRSRGLPDRWAALPMEVLAGGFTADYLIGRLATRRSQRMKALLLDQEVFPGIGNWMADEVLWRSGFHPGRPVSTLSAAEVGQLGRAARRVCRAALRVIGADWEDPPRSWLFPHRWTDGGRCPRAGCGAFLARAPFAGRTTCWCPQCQGAGWVPPGV